MNSFHFKNQISLAVAIIAKDEENNIETALKSVYPIARQIVVIDTGSSDATSRIASRYGAEVYYLKWQNSFADARNAALDSIRAEWTLSIDCDEELDINSVINNIQLFESKNIGGIYVNIVNPLPDGSKSVFKYPRIFRANKNIRFIGAIHEQISESIANLGLEIAESSINILHKGYEEKKPEKIERNERLLKEELAAAPNDDYLSRHLAETHFAKGEFEQAKPLFEQCMQSPDLSQFQKEMSALRLAQISISESNYRGAIELLNFSSRDEDIEGLRLFLLASSRALIGDLTGALEFFKKDDASRSKLVDKDKLNSAIENISKIAGK